MGRPIVDGVAGDAARLHDRSGAALVVTPGDSTALAQSLRTMADMPAAERDALGASGRHFYLDHLSFEGGVGETMKLIERACAEAARRRLMTA